MSLSEEELRFRPFEPLQFSPPVAGSAPNNDVDAHAALQTHLAREGVESVTPNMALDLLASYGLTGDRARGILVELWQHAFKKLLFRDDNVDTGEAVYLDKLKVSLGLTDEEVAAARTDVPKIEPPRGTTSADASTR